MQSLASKMSSYGAYHRNPRNKFMHWFGIPTVTFSILIPMGWLRLTAAGVTFSGAVVFFAAVMLYYLMLDWRLACGVLLGFLPIIIAADLASQLPMGQSLAVFGGSFVGGWILQLVGHYFEKRRPALVDNFSQIFSAPLFLMTELCFALGWRRELQTLVDGPQAVVPNRKLRVAAVLLIAVMIAGDSVLVLSALGGDFVHLLSVRRVSIDSESDPH